MPVGDSTLNGWLIRYGNWIFKTRNWVFPLFMVALFAGFRPVPFLADPSADIWLDAGGVALALLGSLYRAWVIGLAYIKRGGVDRKVYADNLVTTGMFGICRNPLYLGNVMVLVGLFLIHNNPFLYLVGGLVFGISYWAIVRAEEAYLRKKFGPEYEAYCRQVGRFLPNFWRYAKAAEGHRLSWRRAVTKDHGSVVVWLLTAILLYIYERATWSRIDLDAREVSLAIAVSLVVIAAWGLIRVLKKSGALLEPEKAGSPPGGLADFRTEAPFLLPALPLLALMFFGSDTIAFWQVENGEYIVELVAVLVCLFGIVIRMWAPDYRTASHPGTSDVRKARLPYMMAHVGDVTILAGIVVWTQIWWLLPLLGLGAFLTRPRSPIDASANEPDRNLDVGRDGVSRDDAASAPKPSMDNPRPVSLGTRLRIGAIRLTEVMLALLVIESIEELIVEKERLTVWIIEDLPWLLLFAAGFLVAASMWKLQNKISDKFSTN